MNFFFDHNMPPRLARTLDFLEGERGCRVQYLTQVGFAQDAKDSEWIAELEAQGGWVIITKDSGGSKDPSERKAWRECKCPVVLVAGTLLEQDFWELAAKVIKAWPHIKSTIEKSTSMHFLLSANAKITPV